jgi:hypothetical protein
MLKNITIIVLLAMVPLAGGAAGTGEETPRIPKTRTELLNELSLRTAQVALDRAREEYQRCQSDYEDARRFFEQSIISKKELDEALSSYTQARQFLDQAEIRLEETKLGFLDNATHITIVEAKKYYNSDGRRMLDVVLKNTSNLVQAESALAAVDPNTESRVQWQNPESLRALLDIENIIVSIVSDGASIGKPYEEIIPLLPYSEQQKITFELLADVEQTGVKLQYLNQTTIENIYLEKESLQEIPTVVASQFALEGQLGSDVGYALDLEMLVTSVRNFSVAVTNMPPQIRCSFVEGGSRITSVHFSEDLSKHNVMLRASIPQKLDVAMIDKRIDFQAWIATTAQLEQINKLRRQHEPELIPEADLEAIKAARVDLTLIPKGAGRLEIRINNLYMEIKPQQDVELKADLYNDGTLTLFNVTPEISPPLGWQFLVEPKLVERLEPSEKQEVRIHLVPAVEAGVGEYEAQIEARGQSGSEVIDAIEKRLKVRINAETNITATLALVVGLVVMITGIVFMGVKLSRR